MARPQTPPEMIAVHLIHFHTPKGVGLNGYWIGAMRPKRVIIWMHGLGSSMFSKLPIARMLAKNLTAVMMFNNRGHDTVASASRGAKRLKAGAAHERFTDCLDDIDGAVAFAKRTGAGELYLCGHSTGAQKSALYASKRRGIKGIVLLAPISDYASAAHTHGTAAVAKAVSYARNLVKRGKADALIPEEIWPHGLYDAQRFVSLYSGSSPEEVFPYWDPARRARVLRSIKTPTLVVLAENDEYADRSASDMAEWFLDTIYEGEVSIVSDAPHSFSGAEKKTADVIARFLKER